MRSKAGTTDSRRFCRGQTITEYVMFLAATMVLLLVLVFLMRAVGAHGEKTVDRIGYSVP